ncbi:MAG TPA: hypothetical protein PLL78_02995 [Fimbriimonadaceae bacterium]|nr:hypothetical protein [Fimbriimonadaceae bacterium]HRJ95627.1 hypothetical protein [Fimbriimonadaceae bacterium]
MQHPLLGLVAGICVLALGGCSSGGGSSASAPATPGQSGRTASFKKGGYARYVNASDKAVNGFAGPLQIANNLVPGTANSFQLVNRGSLEFRAGPGGGDEFKQTEKLDSEETISVYVYGSGAGRKYKVVRDDLRYSGGADVKVRVANFSNAKVDVRSRDKILASGLGPTGLSDVADMQSGSGSFDISVGGKKVASANGSLASGQAYTVLVLPGSGSGAARAILIQNTIKMEAAAAGGSPN